MGREVVNYGAAVRDGTGDELHIAFAKLDAGARSFTVIDKDLTAPPGSPSIGDAYIVGGSATGAWATHDGKIAVRGLASTWRFVTPAAGMLAYAQDEGTEYRYTGSAWVAVSGAITPFDRGTISSGTETPEPSDGSIQVAVNGGAHTWAAPTATGCFTLTYMNGAAAGAITASGFDVVTDPDEALSHTVENSIIRGVVLSDGVAAELIVAIIEDAT